MGSGDEIYRTFFLAKEMAFKSKNCMQLALCLEVIIINMVFDRSIVLFNEDEF